MKHTKFFLFLFALGTTCYVAYYSIQRNTLAPDKPLSSLVIATIENDKNQHGFAFDVIKDLAHRMTQKPQIQICSAEKALSEIKKGEAHCAILPKKLVKQEKNLIITPITNTENSDVLVVSNNNQNLFKRAHATLLEMSEDGALSDFAHKWHIT